MVALGSALVRVQEQAPAGMGDWEPGRLVAFGGVVNTSAN